MYNVQKNLMESSTSPALQDSERRNKGELTLKANNAQTRITNISDQTALK